MRIASSTLSVLAGQREAAPEQQTLGGSRARSSSTHDNATLIGAGATVHDALAADEIRVRFGIRGRVIDLYSVHPLDTPAFVDAANRGA